MHRKNTTLCIPAIVPIAVCMVLAAQLPGYFPHHDAAAGSDSTRAFADTSVTLVTGAIIERGTGKSMPGVNIFVQGTARGTESDKNGFYSLRAPARSILTVSHVGYLTERLPVGFGGSLDIVMKKGIYKIPLPEISGAYYAKTTPVSAPRRFIRTEQGSYTVLEQMPNFVYGGYAGLALYLRQTAAKVASRLGQTGTVNIGFTINKDASVADFYIIQSDNVLLNREAVSIIQDIEGWIPGMQRGTPVDVRVSLTIHFDTP